MIFKCKNNKCKHEQEISIDARTVICEKCGYKYFTLELPFGMERTKNGQILSNKKNKLSKKERNKLKKSDKTILLKTENN